MQPLIIESMRFDNAGLTIVCLLLLVIVVGLLASLPAIRKRERRLGRIEAQPTFAGKLAETEGKLDAAQGVIADWEHKYAELRGEHARLVAWAQRGPDLAAQPTAAEQHLALVGRRR